MPRITRTVSRSLANRDYIEVQLELREAPEGERFDESGLSPGFSSTFTLWEHRINASGAARKRMEREPDSFGASEAMIIKAFPHLKPFVDLHLSDPDGVPMHAEANGWYWYAGSRPDITTEQYTGYTTSIDHYQLEQYDLPDTDEGRRQYCYRVACNTLRVDEIPLGDIVPERQAWAVWSPVEPLTPEPDDLNGGYIPVYEGAPDFTIRLRKAFREFVEAQRERWAQEAQAARELLESLPDLTV